MGTAIVLPKADFLHNDFDGAKVLLNKYPYSGTKDSIYYKDIVPGWHYQGFSVSLVHPRAYNYKSCKITAFKAMKKEGYASQIHYVVHEGLLTVEEKNNIIQYLSGNPSATAPYKIDVLTIPACSANEKDGTVTTINIEPIELSSSKYLYIFIYASKNNLPYIFNASYDIATNTYVTSPKGDCIGNKSGIEGPYEMSDDAISNYTILGLCI